MADSSPERPEDTRSAGSKAWDLASQITSISLTAVLPAVGGYFVDQWLATGVLFVILGLLLGLFLAVVQMKSLIEKLNRAEG